MKLPCLILRGYRSMHLCFFNPDTPVTDSLIYFCQCIFAAIAFIQQENIIQAYEEHISIIGFEQKFIEIMNYYEDTSIKRPHPYRSFSAIISHSINQSKLEKCVRKSSYVKIIRILNFFTLFAERTEFYRCQN
ncbi:hypothetical protein HZS_7195 [Henneguya salminicola]|nr:hypothetical protein HZS_7195 [Henneguya salminicola]